MEIQLGSRTIVSANDIDLRLSLLLWGSAGCGKTTLAATAPGVKLWLLFDPDGARSLRGREDCMVLDLSGEKNPIVEQFKVDNPLGIEKILTDHPEIETVVFDSVTSFGILATENAISKNKTSSVENPGLRGYGHRNAIVLRACVAMLRLTKRMGRHFILIAHEDSPSTDDNGNVMHITLALGGKMTNTIGMQISECWWLSDTGKERRIAVRPVRQRLPMKTRLWSTTGNSGEFQWRYDADKQTGEGIAEWLEKSKQAKGRKIPLPT